MAASVNMNARIAKKLFGTSLRYWILEYLRIQPKKRKFRALILKFIKDRNASLLLLEVTSKLLLETLSKVCCIVWMHHVLDDTLTIDDKYDAPSAVYSFGFINVLSMSPSSRCCRDCSVIWLHFLGWISSNCMGGDRVTCWWWSGGSGWWSEPTCWHHIIQRSYTSDMNISSGSYCNTTWTSVYTMCDEVKNNLHLFFLQFLSVNR